MIQIEDIWQAGLIKATLSKPRLKSADLRNIYIKAITLQGQTAYQFTYRYRTKDQTHNYDAQAAVDLVEELLREAFYNADFQATDKEYSLLQSKKGKATWRSKARTSTSNAAQHDRQKNRLIPADRPYLQALGLVSSQGKVYQPAQRKYKQINRYIELLTHLLPKPLPQRLRIADMGSGKGYLTFALYDYLTQAGVAVEMTGVEMRPDLVTKCQGIAEQSGMAGLRFVEGSIDSIDIGSQDMVIALHACDIATDMAIAKALEAGARYIVMAPCCHKQIRKAIAGSNLLGGILRQGIFMERQAEMLTDGMRCLLLQSRGYRTQAIEFISAEHTSKNVMLTAVYTGRPDGGALDEVARIKAHFGIEEHYLERLLRSMPKGVGEE